MRATPLQPWVAATLRAAGHAPDPGGLQRYQLERLRATLRLARDRSPFYAEHLAGAAPDLDGLADLAGHPFTTPVDLAAQGPRMVCVHPDDVSRVVTQEQLADLPPAPLSTLSALSALSTLDTSGTTGTPKRLWFSAADQELTVDFFRVGMSTFTEPGDRVLVLLPCERPGGVGDLLATALERLGARPIRHGVVRDLDAALAVARGQGADVAVGVPTQLLALARADDRLRLKAVLLSTDHVPLSLAGQLEKTWDCRVFNHYGMTEMGLGGGVECEAHRGYHLREADLYVEIVDPGTGEPVPDGEPGEVVFTTLTRTAMPLIRYRTGDLSRFLPGPCPCGSWLRVLERITRRAAGVVRLQGGAQLALADLDEALFALPGVVDFDATWQRSAPRERLVVDVRVAGSGAAVGADGALTALRALPAVPADLRVTVTTAGVPSPAKRRMRVVDGDA